jgi:hypothetical protein
VKKRQITDTTHSNAMPPSTGTEAMQGVIPAINRLDRLPADIIYKIIKYLPPTTFLQLGLLCRQLHQVICDAPVWEEIWRTAGLTKPAQKHKSYRELVLVESRTICERCYGKSNASGSNSPLKITDTDDNLMISLCRKCRCEYYNQHPEPYGEEQAGSTQGKWHTVITDKLAKSEYSLTEREIYNVGHYVRSSSVSLYDKQKVVQMARIIHGGDIGIESARNAAIKKGNAISETLRRNKEAKEAQLEQSLAEANIPDMIDNHICREYIRSSEGKCLALIIIELQAEVEELRLRESRALELYAAMEAAGLRNAPYSQIVEDYIELGTGTVEDVISLLRRLEEERRLQDARRLEITAAVEAAVLQNANYSISYINYIFRGTGSVEYVISQLRRPEASISQGVRRHELIAKLAAAGFTQSFNPILCRQYICSGTGNADSIVDTMKEMDWFFMCTSYATSRRMFYTRHDDRDHDISDDDRVDDHYYNVSGARGRWLKGSALGRPRRRFHIDRETAKDLALQTWLTNRFERRLYQCVEHDQNDPSRPPTSLWPTIDEKWETALQTHAIEKLAPHYRTYTQTMRPVEGETPVSEIQVISWLDQPEVAIGIPLSTLLSRIMGYNWHQRLIARISTI